eukprot:GHUV01010775.1.p2 GENE.GHUV01010775.1~~GHUV01010775.1.p2  ORF type:complete len:175 (+),score=38.89 GHUV01010775.1:748-1272(+)
MNYTYQAHISQQSSRPLLFAFPVIRHQKQHLQGPQAYPGQCTRLPVAVRARMGTGASEDEVWRHLEKMADKYIVGSSNVAKTSRGVASPDKSDIPIQGIHILLSTLAIVWLITSSSALPAISVKVLSLEHSMDKWWSAVTDAFVSSSSQALARNFFFGYMFGRVVENSESTGAL